MLLFISINGVKGRQHLSSLLAPKALVGRRLTVVRIQLLLLLPSIPAPPKYKCLNAANQVLKHNDNADPEDQILSEWREAQSVNEYDMHH